MKHRVLWTTFDERTEQELEHVSGWYDTRTLAQGAAMILERDEATRNVRIVPMNKVIYHGGCDDGFCSAWVAAHFLNLTDADLIRASYGSPPPLDELDGVETVYIVDFSYPASDLINLAKHVGRVVVLDHHKTAEAELGRIGDSFPQIEVHFDMNRSGAGITFDYFDERCHHMPGLVTSEERDKMQAVVKYVQDRDLWRWALEDSREVSAFIRTLPKTIEGWDVLLDIEMTHILIGGRAVTSLWERQIEELTRASKWRLCAFKAWDDIAIINICIAAPGSEVLNVLCEERPFAVGWAQNGDGTYYYSLRSDAGGVDVGILARSIRETGVAFAGGGHARAAGFSSPCSPEELFHGFVSPRERILR